MHEEVFVELLILLIVVWTAAVGLRYFGVPTVMGELIAGVILGPAVLGWVEPSEIFEVLAEMGIFFLLLHTGVETKPREFFEAIRISVGVAVVGAVAPFGVSVLIALAFGLTLQAAVFVGLTMTATAVVVTIKILRDLNLHNTRMARVIVASCVLDDLFTLVLFSVFLSIINHGHLDPVSLLWILLRVTFYFVTVFAFGHFLYPLFKHPFRNREGKGFAFLLVIGLVFGLFAEAMGLHIILGAYLAGLFFREEVASDELIQKVQDRLDGIAYTFLGPIFFISLGFNVTFDVLKGGSLWFILALSIGVYLIQIISAGGMARRLGFSPAQSCTVGVGMCGRAEMAFVLASLGLSLGLFNSEVFSAVIFTTFILNILTPIGLKICSGKLSSESAPIQCLNDSSNDDDSNVAKSG